MNAERVMVRCPVCGWGSAEVEVVSESPNGRWFAFNKAAIEYRDHHDLQHPRPAPEMVIVATLTDNETPSSLQVTPSPESDPA